MNTESEDLLMPRMPLFHCDVVHVEHLNQSLRTRFFHCLKNRFV